MIARKIVVAGVVAASMAFPAAAGASPLRESASSTVDATSQSLTIVESAVHGVEARTVEAIDYVGLRLNLLPGDSVKVIYHRAYIYNANHRLITSIRADVPIGKKISYSAQTGILSVDGTSESPENRCTSNKWAKWFVQGAFDGLVCLPVGVAAGAATAGVGVAAGIGCHIVTSGLTTAISC